MGVFCVGIYWDSLHQIRSHTFLLVKGTEMDSPEPLSLLSPMLLRSTEPDPAFAKGFQVTPLIESAICFYVTTLE